MAALAVMVLAVIGGVFRPGGDSPGAPAAAVSSSTPSAGPSATAGAPTPSLRPTATLAPSPTTPPTPTVPPPTSTPTRPPTLPPTATPQLPTPAPTVPPITADLVVLEPADGEIVDERVVRVRGLGPPGATITHDIPFWFDDHTTADRRGRWSFSIELVPGDNELTFRIGDDAGTSRTLTVRYQPD